MSRLHCCDNLHYEKFADGSVKCIEDEIPFDLPEGWAWARLGTIAEAIGDGDHQPPPQTSFGIPFLVISNVSGGRLSFENTRFVGEEYFNQLPETRRPRNGDLLFTVTGSYGIPILVDTDDKFCFQRHIAIVRPCIISNHYLYIALGSSYVKSICDDKATGTAQKTVGLATLRELLVPVAPYKEQMQIYTQAQAALHIVDSISSDKEDLLSIIETTKSKILDLAIRGKLVPQDPNDEPASVLLERIRAEKEELIKQGKIKRDKKSPSSSVVRITLIMRRSVLTSFVLTQKYRLRFLILGNGCDWRVVASKKFVGENLLNISAKAEPLSLPRNAIQNTAVLMWG